MRPPWDESAIDRRLLTAVAEACHQPLDDAKPHSSPAAYLLYYHGDLALYRRVVETLSPIYVGSSKNTRRRLGEHRASIRAVRSLAVADFAVRVVETPTHDAAVYAESRLITLYQPAWNTDDLAGFGSKHQGLGRIAAQEPSPWDTIHPGRRWARPPDRRTRKRTLSSLEAVLSSKTMEAVPGDESLRRDRTGDRRGVR